MLTVALDRLLLSMSFTVNAGSMTVATSFSVKAKVPPVVPTTGASFTAFTLMLTLSLSVAPKASVDSMLSVSLPLKFSWP